MIMLAPQNRLVFILPAVVFKKANFDNEIQEKAAFCCRNGTLVFVYLLFRPSTVLWMKLKLLALVKLTAG